MITTLGVSLGVGIVYFWPQLKVVDPLLALLVALQILRTGYELTQKSFWGLLDRALPQEEQEQIEKIVKNHSVELTLHNLRTRKSGKKRFIELSTYFWMEKPVCNRPMISVVNWKKRFARRFLKVKLPFM